MSKARDLADFQGSASALTTGTLPVDRVPYVGRRNLIINGGFDVWQRGTSWTSATNGQYTVDRWQTFGSSMTCNIDRSTDVPANQGFKYSVKVVRTANELPFLRQLIEDFDTVVVGRDWTASFWAKADTACTISVDLGDTGSTTVSIGTSWEKHTVYFPSTLTPTYTALDFQSNSSDTPMYFTGVQLELGSVATPFEHRSYGEELALCQRYYETCVIRDAGNYEHQRIASNSAYSYTHPPVRYKVTKRVAPSVTIYGLNGTAGAVNLNGANSNYTAVYQNGTDQFSIYKSIPSGYLNYFFEFDWTADAEL